MSAFIDPTDRFHFKPISENKKLGGLPATTMPRKFCQSVDCAFRGNGCYAENFPLSLHWDKVSAGERGDTFEDFLGKLRNISRGQLWRHAQAGETPLEAFLPIARAARRARGFGYTHHRPSPVVVNLLKNCAALNLRINISADSIADADTAIAAGLPAVTVLPSDETRVAFDTDAGNRVVVCPHERTGVSCAQCQLCYERPAHIIIGFPAHGTAKRKADLAVRDSNRQPVHA